MNFEGHLQAKRHSFFKESKHFFQICSRLAHVHRILVQSSLKNKNYWEFKQGLVNLFQGKDKHILTGAIQDEHHEFALWKLSLPKHTTNSNDRRLTQQRCRKEEDIHINCLKWIKPTKHPKRKTVTLQLLQPPNTIGTFTKMFLNNLTQHFVILDKGSPVKIVSQKLFMKSTFSTKWFLHTFKYEPKALQISLKISNNLGPQKKPKQGTRKYRTNI